MFLCGMWTCESSIGVPMWNKDLWVLMCVPMRNMDLWVQYRCCYVECGLVGPVCVLLCGAGTCGSYECSSVHCRAQLNMGCCICPRTHELLIHVFLIIHKSYSRSDVFSAGVWSDLSSIEDPELQQLAQSLPSLVVLYCQKVFWCLQSMEEMG